MTSGIVMLGTQSHHVDDLGGTNVYALAFGKTKCILSRVTSLGKETPHLAMLLT